MKLNLSFYITARLLITHPPYLVVLRLYVHCREGRGLLFAAGTSSAARCLTRESFLGDPERATYNGHLPPEFPCTAIRILAYLFSIGLQPGSGCLRASPEGQIQAKGDVPRLLSHHTHRRTGVGLGVVRSTCPNFVRRHGSCRYIKTCALGRARDGL